MARPRMAAGTPGRFSARWAVVWARRSAWKWPLVSMLLALVGWAVALQAVVTMEARAKLAHQEALAGMTAALATYQQHTLEVAVDAIDEVCNALRRGNSLSGTVPGQIVQAPDTVFRVAGVIDPHGRFPASAAPDRQQDLSSSSAFKTHAGMQAAHDKLYFGNPERDPETGEGFFQVSKGAYDEQGRFLGVVVVSFSEHHLRNEMRLATLKDGSLAALVRQDGRILASTLPTSNPLASGQSLRPESLPAAFSHEPLPAQLLGQPARTYAWRAFPDLPLFTVAAVGMDDSLTATTLARQVLAILAIMLSLAAVLAFVRQWREAESRQDLLAQLTSSEQRLKTAATFRERFLDSVSHELRTPLNGILVASEILAASAADAESEELSRTILLATRQLDSMIGSLLDIAAIESGRSVLAPRSTDLASLADQILNAYAQVAESKGLRLQVWVGEGSVGEVCIDRTKVMQLTHCLADNALRFTHKGSVMIKLDAQPRQDLVIQIADSGVGMPQEQVEQLCGASFADTARPETLLGGIGLGLNLVRGLVRLMHGRLNIQSVAGQGTVAKVELPLESPA